MGSVRVMAPASLHGLLQAAPIALRNILARDPLLDRSIPSRVLAGYDRAEAVVRIGHCATSCAAERCQAMVESRSARLASSQQRVSRSS
jgi:hypothetical protein